MSKREAENVRVTKWGKPAVCWRWFLSREDVSLWEGNSSLLGNAKGWATATALACRDGLTAGDPENLEPPGPTTSIAGKGHSCALLLFSPLELQGWEDTSAPQQLCNLTRVWSLPCPSRRLQELQRSLLNYSFPWQEAVTWGVSQGAWQRGHDPHFPFPFLFHTWASARIVPFALEKTNPSLLAFNQHVPEELSASLR